MHYEHLVQVNDLEQPDLPVLERSQLWFGLLARAERPMLFDASIDESTELRRDTGIVEHQLTRGAVRIRETVHLMPERSIVIDVGAGTDFAGSTLTIAIEEPAPLAFFLRFTYELRGPSVPVDDGERQALRQAYYHADLETVRRIRSLAPGVLCA